MAAQMLAGQGFDRVINVSGGFKAWQGEAAYGDELLGLELFSGDETPETTLVVAYSLEAGLRDFYLSMAPRAPKQAAQKLFNDMADIELKHQDRIFSEYCQYVGQTVDRKTFEQKTLEGVIEGGLTTEEYIKRFNPSLDSTTDIISLAMSIEAQALDLYQRVADKTSDAKSQAALRQIADEEKAHLAQLGKLMDSQ